MKCGKSETLGWSACARDDMEDLMLLQQICVKFAISCIDLPDSVMNGTKKKEIILLLQINTPSRKVVFFLERLYSRVQSLCSVTHTPQYHEEIGVPAKCFSCHQTQWRTLVFPLTNTFMYFI